MSLREHIDGLAAELRRLLAEGRGSRAATGLQERAGLVARALTSRHLLDDSELVDLAVETEHVIGELREL